MSAKPCKNNKVTIVETIIGLFAVNEEKDIVEYSVYPIEVDKILEILQEHDEGIITPRLEKIIQALMKKGYKRIYLPSEKLAESVKKEDEVLTSFSVDEEANTHVRESIFELAQKYQGLNQDGYLRLNHVVSDALSKRTIQRKLSEREALIIQTVQLLGEVDVILNNLNSRLREWYGLHFPELGLRIKDHQTYVKIVSLIGERAYIDSEKLQALGIKPRLSQKIEELAETSMGAPLRQEDMIGIRELANLITELEKYRETHANYIVKITEELAPNISTLAGPLLTAKLIENAGSLKRMAMLPSSTIQVLGAGKAMFRAIKTGAKPPKHGLLFQHPYVHGANRKERGKRARELAGKIAIASRADYFTGNFIADQLKEKLSMNEK